MLPSLTKKSINKRIPKRSRIVPKVPKENSEAHGYDTFPSSSTHPKVIGCSEKQDSEDGSKKGISLWEVVSSYQKENRQEDLRFPYWLFLQRTKTTNLTARKPMTV